MSTAVLTNTKNVYNLNAGQTTAAEGFFQFLFSKGNELVISGPGGVGKTHLMGHLIDQIMPRYLDTCKLMGLDPQYTEVIMTATTNKAAEVLAAQTNRPTKTIHSFLGLKVKEDYATGKTTLTKTSKWTIHDKKIIFIDEASMIDTSLWTMIKEATHNCKVVYVGDHCQMAPIMEPISPIYRQRLPFFELTEPMRTGNPHLQAINDQLRETVKTGIFKPIQIIPGVIDHLDDAAMQAEIDSTFLGINNNSRILAYTNKRVVEYNDHIRDIRQLVGTYSLGERLVNNSAVPHNGGMISVEEELTVESLGPATQMVPVEPGVDLEVRYANLRSSHSLYVGVPLPENKAHYNALIRYYKQMKNWNRYFYLKNHFPDLRPRDAATLHKAQGSSYDTVFIDLGNLSTCHNPSQVSRLLYVGFSRTRHRILLYGTLAEKYGGLCV